MKGRRVGSSARWRWNKGPDGECSQRRQTDGCFITAVNTPAQTPQSCSPFLMILTFLCNECQSERRQNTQKRAAREKRRQSQRSLHHFVIETSQTGLLHLPPPLLIRENRKFRRRCELFSLTWLFRNGICVGIPEKTNGILGVRTC